MDGIRFNPRSLPLLAGLVFVSSFLGLTGRYVLVDGGLEGAFGFFVGVWSASLVADVVFVAASVAAFVATFAIARRRGAAVGGLAAFGLHWIAYTASFLLLPEDLRFGTSIGSGAAEAAGFVLSWGFPGLLFAGLAPVFVMRIPALAASLPTVHQPREPLA